MVVGPDERWVRGDLSVLNHTVIHVGDREVLVSRIRALCTKDRKSHVGGVAGLAGGAVVAVIGVLVISVQQALRELDPNVDPGISKGGAVITVLGVSVMGVSTVQLIRGRKCKPAAVGRFLVQ